MGLAIGMTFMIVTAGIDLSVGSMIGFAGIIIAVNCSEMVIGISFLI